MLDRFQRIESSLFEWRREVVDWFDITLREMGRIAWDILQVSWLIIADLLRFAFDFGREYVDQLLTRINRYLDRVSAVLRDWIQTVRRIHAAIQAVLEFNLMPLIIAGLLGPLGVAIQFVPSIRSRIPRLTIDDLISMLIAGGLAILRAQLRAWIVTVETAIRAAIIAAPWPLDDEIRDIIRRHNIYARLDALREIVNLTLTPPRWVPPPPARFTVNPPPFPNLHRALFGPGSIPIGRVLMGVLQEARTGLVQFLSSGAELAKGVARQAEAGAREFSRLGSVETINRMSEHSRDIAEGLFGAQTRTLRARIERRRDPFAQGFEAIIAGFGLDTVFSALPTYLASVRRYWARRRESTESGDATDRRRPSTPTSPHILARRAKLGRVHMTQLRIEASVGRLDEAFTELVATRISEAVAAAYQAGHAAHEAAA
ncbi:MAG: hypothetical protein ACYSTL_08680 [Planctomycetota bacterium]|jgi:hypothetical protein